MKEAADLLNIECGIIEKISIENVLTPIEQINVIQNLSYTLRPAPVVRPRVLAILKEIGDINLCKIVNVYKYYESHIKQYRM